MAIDYARIALRIFVISNAASARMTWRKRVKYLGFRKPGDNNHLGFFLRHEQITVISPQLCEMGRETICTVDGSRLRDEAEDILWRIKVHDVDSQFHEFVSISILAVKRKPGIWKIGDC